MDPSAPASDLVVPAPPEQVSPQDFVVRLTRVYQGDFFTLHFVRSGREISEELDPDATRKFFMERFTKARSIEQHKAREEGLEKALDETWNFYQSIVTIPADVYCEPSLPFAQFQPKV